MEHVIARIQKLLALAGNNSNEHEAAAAAEKAAALMAEHNLSALVVNRANNTHAKRKDQKRKGGLYQWQRDVWKAVARMNFCYYMSIKGLSKGSTYEQRIVGSEVNVLSTELMGEYLQSTIDRMAQQKAKEIGLKSVFAREAIAYREGLATGIVRRIDAIIEDRETEARHQQYRNSSTGSTALTIVDVTSSENDLNTDYLNGLEPGTTAANRAKQEAEYRVRMEAKKKWEEENPELARKQKEENAKYWEEYFKEREKKEAARAKRRKKGPTYRNRAPTERELRAGLSTYYSGVRDSEKVSLDKQVDEDKPTRIS